MFQNFQFQVSRTNEVLMRGRIKEMVAIARLARGVQRQRAATVEVRTRYSFFATYEDWAFNAYRGNKCVPVLDFNPRSVLTWHIAKRRERYRPSLMQWTLTLLWQGALPSVSHAVHINTPLAGSVTVHLSCSAHSEAQGALPSISHAVHIARRRERYRPSLMQCT